MSEAPKRIWAMAPGLGHNRLIGTYVDRPDQEDRIEYIRADLVEAAIKRALEAAAEEASVCWMDGVPYPECEDYIRRLDPAQFIEEPKQ